MRLFRSQKTDVSGSKDHGIDNLSIKYQRRALAIRLSVLVVVLVAVILTAAWVFHSPGQTKSSSQKNLATSQNSKGDTKSSTTSTSQAAASTTPSSSNLTNTGPGDVVGLFVATSLAAAGFYYLVILRILDRDPS